MKIEMILISIDEINRNLIMFCHVTRLYKWETEIFHGVPQSSGMCL
jgi:hypothetical protein